MREGWGLSALKKVLVKPSSLKSYHKSKGYPSLSTINLKGAA